MSEDEQPKERSPWPIIFVLGIIFLPGGVLAFMLWSLLRWGRQRPSVIGAVAALSIVVAALIGLVGWSSLSRDFQTLTVEFSGSAAGAVALAFLPLWLSLSLVLGALAGWGASIYSARQMVKNPYLTKLAGSWRYNFTYRRTPREFLARRKKIRALKNGLYIEEHKAPLGLEEATDQVAFRYDSEARKHTFLTGASGSGKAIHASTLIPTVLGFKRAGRVRTGDMLLNPLGLPTKVLGVYQPMTQDHFLLSFSNGETVKACGDHLWTVKEAGGDLTPQVISTRKIAENPSNWYISPLRSPTQTTQHSPINPRLLGAWLASGVPQHGAIVKPSLMTKNFESTHEQFVRDLQASGWLTSTGDFGDFDYDVLMSSPQYREELLRGAVEICGSYTLNGQTKMSLPDKQVAEFLRSAVFSLGVQCGQLEEYESAYSFRFTRRGKRSRSGSFSVSLGDISRKGAPNRGLIKIVSVEPIDDSPEHYFCFEVDSPDHMFLIGRSFMPTHNTITMQSLIYSDIEVGKPVVIIDFKRSPKFAAKVAQWAKDYEREFYHFVNGDEERYDIPNSVGQSSYDPLGSGTPTSKADMVLGMREYDTAAAVYKTAMQQLLQVIFNMLKYADRSKAPSIDWNHGGIFQLASVLAGNGLGELAAANTVQVPPGSSKYTYVMPGSGGASGDKVIYVNSPVAKQATELIEALRSKGSLSHAKEELQGQLRTIIASEYGLWMRSGEGKREIDLYSLISNGAPVILFSLNSDSEPEFAKYVGSMIFSDLTNISALRRNAAADNQVNIYVDEFQAVPPSAVTSLLEKSRESKMALTIAQQSFDQVVASAESAGEAYLNSILDTCSNFIAHAGATEKSATRLAEILGKEFVTVYSKTNESASSFLSTNWARNQSSRVAAREEERWKFPPSSFMELSSPDEANNFKSSAVFVTKTSGDPRHNSRGGAVARTVWMIPPDPVLIEYYEGSERSAKTVKPKESTLEERLAESLSIDEQPQQGLEQELKRQELLQRAQAVAQYDYEHDDDDEEEWDFEEIPDSELDEQELEEPQPAQEYSLDELFSNDDISPETTNRTEVERESQSKKEDSSPKPPKSSGLPTRPGTGLPLRPPTSTRPPDDETPLPKI